ncbi:hypothetical protein CLU79DRAFT_780124 [Phycomyces nitens]|nr:hypothetical protein CLU79DRAFT_780124 [Phycomyces nitens]
MAFITAESFTLTHSHNPSNGKRKSILKQALPINKKKKPLEKVFFDKDDEKAISVPHPPILKGLVVFIDDRISNADTLKAKAHALDATVAEDMNSSVTHIVLDTHTSLTKLGVHKPQTGNNAPRKGPRLVSPMWVHSCFRQNQRLATHFFPYDCDQSSPAAGLFVGNTISRPDEEEDPFGVTSNTQSAFSRPPSRPDNQSQSSYSLASQQSFAPFSDTESIIGERMPQDMVECDVLQPTQNSQVSSRADKEKQPVQDTRQRFLRMIESCKASKPEGSSKTKKPQYSVLSNTAKTLSSVSVSSSDVLEQAISSEPGSDTDSGNKATIAVWYGEQSFYFDSQSSSGSRLSLNKRPRLLTKKTL